MDSAQNQFRNGLQDALSIAIGYIPIAIAFGFLAKSTGLTFLETVLMSGFVFAGASQFMALNLLLVSSHFEIILATFILNIRHLLMSTTIQKLTAPAPTWVKVICAFGVTDESFSVATTKQKSLTSSYLIALNFTAYLSWVLFSGVGFLFGSFLPKSIQESTAIALYAMFIGLLVPVAKKSKKVLCLAILSAGLNCFFVELHILSSGWSIILSTLLSAVSIEWLFQKLLSEKEVSI